ncbi:MAG: ABC transporter ATP-binding protein [Acetobacteraceae bacterium]|nr:ABC transporter ATP-binding protein [Acetobacteraceae bacterium]
MPAAAAPALLHLERVSRTYDGGRIVALRDVTLSIHLGEFIAVHGQSGSGKSTLINLLSGIEIPTSGVVSFEHLVSPSAAAWTALRGRRIGIVFQDFNLLPTLTAAENVEISMFGQPGGAAVRRGRALALLEDMGIAHRSGLRPQELSGGERRRAGIARGLANRPEILLADEPTSNLDSATGQAIIDLLFDLHQRGHGMTMVIVSHDPALIARCSRRIRLLDGAIVEDTSTVPAWRPAA